MSKVKVLSIDRTIILQDTVLTIDVLIIGIMDRIEIATDPDCKNQTVF